MPNVLREFVFSRQPKDGQKLPTETIVKVGEQDFDEEMAAHPWIIAGADGAIESPEQAAARAEASAKAAKAAADDAELQQKRAEEALARASAAAAKGAADSEVARKGLDTPVHQAAVERGAGVDSPTPGEQTPTEPESGHKKKK